MVSQWAIQPVPKSLSHSSFDIARMSSCSALQAAGAANVPKPLGSRSLSGLHCLHARSITSELGHVAATCQGKHLLRRVCRSTRSSIDVGVALTMIDSLWVSLCTCKKANPMFGFSSGAPDLALPLVPFAVGFFALSLLLACGSQLRSKLGLQFGG